MILPTFESTGTFSYEQFLRFAEELHKQTDLFHCELLNGRICMTPPAGGLHGAVQDNLYRPISVFVHEKKLGRVFGSSTDYRLTSNDLVEPDVGFVAAVRLAALPPLEAGKFLEVVPDLAIEIVSPSDPERDLVEKRVIYEQNGVNEYWIVDPAAKTVLLLVRIEGRFQETRIEYGGAVESRAVPGLRMLGRDVFDGVP